MMHASGCCEQRKRSARGLRPLTNGFCAKPGRNPHLSALDLTMMTLFGSQERTEENWRELLKSEGLQLVAVHTIPSCLKSVLEVQLI